MNRKTNDPLPASRHSRALDALVQSARRPRRQRRSFPLPEPPTPERLACENPDTMPKSLARVLGPYANGSKWRLVLLDGSSRKSLLADTYEAALKLSDELTSRILAHVSRTFGEALAEYFADMAARGVLAVTIAHTQGVLRRFLPLEAPLSSLSVERAEQMYLDVTQRQKANGEPIAADTHHHLLRRVKEFYKWALSRRYVECNPFSEIRPVGRARRGKLQLRIDEARRFVGRAIEKAHTLDVGATAALMQILLGLRPTEAVVRVVRDLDDAGRVLWVPFGKTNNAKRRLQVPEPLREVLLKHAASKPADAALLGPPGEPLHTRKVLLNRVRQICEDTDVPRVCPHSLRGLNATLALEAGATAHSVAAALGHASFKTTALYYADASVVANASLRKVADLLSMNAEQPLEVHHLASLLREQLTAEQLVQLRKSLAA